MAHIDAGKTTTTERILYYSGRLHKMGEVHEGAATMDWMEQEQERGITITSAATTVFWKDAKINIIDTPGHVDFTIEVERSFAFSMVLWLYSTLYQVLSRNQKRYGVKRTNTGFLVLRLSTRWTEWVQTTSTLIKSMREKLHANAIAVHCPIGAEGAFKGMVDLVTMRAMFFHDETFGQIGKKQIFLMIL